MRPVTPRGFRDVLPREAAERESLIGALNRTLSLWGYDPVETPLVEVYETLTAAAGDLEGTAFRFFDVDGRQLALRPDVTVPIARLVAARLGDAPTPVRLRYTAQVFREHESLRGQSRQFTQVGIELVGAAGPAADAEVVAALIEALCASGLREFTVAVGDVAVLFALLDAAGCDASWHGQMLRAAHDRNLVALDALTRAAGVEPCVGAAIREVVRTRGGAEAIAACGAIIEPVGCGSVLSGLEETFALLGAASFGDRVVVDFGVMRSFDYYTGLVLEAYAPGLGVPLAGGGRYDEVLAAYGVRMPAVGFALGLERLTIALAEQGVSIPTEPEPVLMGGEAEAGFAEAAARRARGERVALMPGLRGEELARRAAELGTQGAESR